MVFFFFESAELFKFFHKFIGLLFCVLLVFLSAYELISEKNDNGQCDAEDKSGRRLQEQCNRSCSGEGLAGPLTDKLIDRDARFIDGVVAVASRPE